MTPKQTLSQAARRKFGLTRELFSDNFSSAEDIYFNPELRYIRECLYGAARHGGFLALVGESGSGKSTLRRDLISRLAAEDSRVIPIEPYVLGLDKNERRSLGVSAKHITESILSALDPEHCGATLSAERLFRRMHERLRESSRAGNRHLLIIEEAHSLPLRTIKQLKRFYELDDGLTRLLSILLLGQPELRSKLADGATAWDVREVVQRLEILELYPLDDLEGYVRHRCVRVGAKYEDIFDASALDALRLRLSGPSPRNGQAGQSLLYPLLVGNTLTAAVNKAAELKMPRVTADVIAGA
ncbi:MAG: AAA family ATPase [Deltaproteobacteria bacterium]|jgi:type II secretory pathway predicted ATPase ExeA|nr:AAA family ATPase [Deltaproteobacteria bacterium]